MHTWGTSILRNKAFKKHAQENRKLACKMQDAPASNVGRWKHQRPTQKEQTPKKIYMQP